MLRPKITWTFQKLAGLLEKFRAFIEIHPVLFSSAVGGVTSHQDESEPASSVIVVIFVPRRVFALLVTFVPGYGACRVTRDSQQSEIGDFFAIELSLSGLER